MTERFYHEIIKTLLDREFTESEFTTLKRNLCLTYGLKKIPTNVEILLHAPIELLPILKKKLLSKPIRSGSGVAPVAIMTKPINCPHGRCIMCPGGINSHFGDVPQSYTGKEPATMRGIRNGYDAYLQVCNRLEQYALLGHNFEKVELIIMGGTFPAFPKSYQESFVAGALKAMNDFSEQFYTTEGFDYITFKTFFELPPENLNDIQRESRIKKKLLELKGEPNLLREQERNETAKVRCVALCIETKPDWGLLEHGNTMLELGCTRVELGIQSVYEDVITHIHRGHTIKDTTDSIRILKDLGFKVAGHYMPGLPLTSKERDIAGMKELFSNPNYKPDMLKIYPTMVSEGTALFHQYKEGKFTPITAHDAAELLIEFKKNVPTYCRIMRIQRDVPTKQWVAGVEMTNFRQWLHAQFPVTCRCIRCREPHGKKVDWNTLNLQIEEYDASKGKEYFISIVDTTNDIIIGFCRLRFPSESLRTEISKNSALIRELHVYGTATGIGEEGTTQHRGLGKKMLEKAEEIAKDNNKQKMVIISGIGVREYYKKLGYHKEGPYMVKSLWY